MDLFKYTYHSFIECLPPKICDEIIDYGLSLKKQEGTIISNKQNKKRRNSFVTWIKPLWIYKEIRPYIIDSNKLAGWDFDIDKPETFQFTEYQGSKKQHYGWHTDVHLSQLKDKKWLGKYRKVSTTVLLNRPDEYEGGDLEFYDYSPYPSKNKLKTEHLKKQGTIINFPSFVFHRVKPVTKGTRYSLVVWHTGPKLK